MKLELTQKGFQELQGFIITARFYYFKEFKKYRNVENDYGYKDLYELADKWLEMFLYLNEQIRQEEDSE